MKNKLVKLGVSVLLLVSLLLPNTMALASDGEKGDWTTMASMSMPRLFFQTEVIDGNIYAIGGTNSSILAILEKYEPSNNTWSTLASMSTRRAYFQTETIDGKIYAIGGLRDGSTYLNTAEVYDPSTDSWTKLSSMLIGRSNFQTEVIDGKIYVIGGMTSSSTCTSSVEVYNPSTNTWTSLASMSTPRGEFQTKVLEGKIYVIGGRNYGDVLSTTEVYDPSTNKWTTLSPMSERRYNFQAEVVDSKIYAFGGMTLASPYHSSVEVYDPSSDTWLTLAQMSTPRTYFQSEVINGKIYAIGGICESGGAYGATSLSSAEIYDLSSNTWSTLAPMTTGRRCFETVVVNGTIYALGGHYFDGVNLLSMEKYNIISPSTSKLKVVLEKNETLQLSVDDNLTENAKFTWSSSNNAVASVNENGVVTALANGNATITVSDGASYTESINVLVVENADTYRLAIDLNVGNTSRLTVDDYTNTANATWVSSDPAVATITNAGRVTAVKAGLTLITATDVDKNQIGQAYVRVRA